MRQRTLEPPGVVFSGGTGNLRFPLDFTYHGCPRNTDSGGVLHVAEKMRDNVLTLRIPKAFSGVSNVVTISIGIATAFPSRDLPSELLLKTADDQLYEAKKEGRNKILRTEVDLLE